MRTFCYGVETLFLVALKPFLWHFTLFRVFIYSLLVGRKNGKHGKAFNAKRKVVVLQKKLSDDRILAYHNNRPRNGFGYYRRSWAPGPIVGLFNRKPRPGYRNRNRRLES